MMKLIGIWIIFGKNSNSSNSYNHVPFDGGCIPVGLMVLGACVIFGLIIAIHSHLSPQRNLD